MNQPQSKSQQDTPMENTDRELYREPAESEGMSYYSNSIHVTKDGRIGMNVGGRVIVQPIADWHKLAEGNDLRLDDPEATTTATITSPKEDTTITSELDKLIAKYDDWHECDEYHIHDGTDEHEGRTPLPHDFDDDKLKAALTNLIAQEKIELLEAIKMNTWSTDKCWGELNDMLDKLKGRTNE